MLADEGDVLDLDVAGGPAIALQQQVDAAVGAVFHLAAQRCVACQFRQCARCDGLLGDAVGQAGVDADEADARLVRDMPGMGVFARRAFGASTARYPAGPARSEPQHGAGVGAGGGEFFACLQPHIGQEALVAPEQRGGNERR
jgi:hypothetical protein